MNPPADLWAPPAVNTADVFKALLHDIDQLAKRGDLSRDGEVSSSLQLLILGAAHQLGCNTLDILEDQAD